MNISPGLIRRSSIVAISLLLGACALSNPYVKVPVVDTTTCAADCTIDQAQAYSRSVRQAFRQRLGAQAQLRSNSGAAEILLGAAALGLGAANANRDAFVGAGIAGATTYGLATWFGNADLERVYAAAMMALGCAESAVEPLRLSKIENDELSTALTTVVDNTAPLIESLAILDDILIRGRAQQQSLAVVRGGQSLNALQQAQLNALSASIADAASISALGSSTLTRVNAAYAGGLRLRHLNGVAGNQLARTVERIVAAVDDEARKSQPDPASVFKIVADLSGLAAKIVPGLDLGSLLQKDLTKAIPAGGERQGKPGSTLLADSTSLLVDALQSAATSVATKTRTLVAATSRMEVLVAQAGNMDVSTSLAQCGIAASTNLVLLPSSITLKVGANTAAFRVSGGKPPYSGTLVGLRPAGMALDNPITGDRGFTVTTTAATPAGDYAIAVSDASMKEIALAIKIAPATAVIADTQSPAPALTPTPTLTSAALTGLADSIATLIGKSIPGTNAKITKVSATTPSTIVIATDVSGNAAELATQKVAIEKLLIAGGSSVKDEVAKWGATLVVTQP